MKIAIICNGYPPTAPSMSYVHARAKQYQELGHEVWAFIQPKDGREESNHYENIKVVKKNIKSIIKDINYFSPDILAVHAPHRWSLVVASNLSFPVFSWIHGHETLHLRNYNLNSGLLKQLFYALYDAQKLFKLRKFYKKCAAVLYVSQWMKENAERNLGISHPNSFIIPNSVNNNLFNFNLKTNYNNPPKGISIRNLTSPKYGLDIAIRAYANLKETELTIVGTGRLEKELRKLIKAVNANVNIIAQKYDHDEMPNLLKYYDYFVAPSRLEAQGVAMCEAMSMGLPVVATKVGGIPEFVTHGEEGYLVPPENPPALREAIIKLVKNPNFEKFSQNSAKKIQNICSPENTIRKELEIMQNAGGDKHVKNT